ncbi:VOC family protein [filamentous cyanobacterium LEGE 11480]|uniref:VOC family protein n=1 Tax=Romeriopsis navalis LEGE 11480 TaxID=2777977 RepID=A0A928VH50_9CYAN|nr:VOC family protein [Romeriopsis navalis]MBE9028513.1 VOC family protein [Romeriopsis navalis LEGE 11480]
MQINHFLHTALNVTDLAKAEHFYSDILGLQKAERDLKFPGIWYQIGDYQLHLLVAPENPPSKNQERWGRNRHLAFSVSDIAAVKQRLTAAGQNFQVSGSGRPAVFVRDPDDNVIELGEI